MRRLPVLLIASAAAYAYEPQWRQPRLFVSFWYDPPVPPADYPAVYKQIADANFTAILGGFGALTAAAVEAQLSAADALGLGVVAATNYGKPTALPISDYGGAHPSLWGYQVKDEPSVADFGAVAAYSDAIAAAVPGKLRYTNLLPHCPLAQLNASSYDAYVGAYVRTVRPDVLSFDYYPSFQTPEWGAPPSMADYRANLADVRRHALGAGVPFWNFFGVQHVFGGQPDPTEAQIRWQVFTSLAHGAKGVMYFCYWGGILAERRPWKNASGGGAPRRVLTRHYAEARRVNTDVLAWEAHLLPARSTGAWLANSTGAPPLPPASAVATLNAVATDQGPSGNFVVGQFTLAQSGGGRSGGGGGVGGGNKTLVMVVNQDPNFNVLANVTFRADAGAFVCEVTRAHGQEVDVIDDTQEAFEVAHGGGVRPAAAAAPPPLPSSPPLQLFIGAGDARLLVLSDVPCAHSAA